MVKNNIPWMGASGAYYYHSIHSFNATWRYGSAIFIFARELRSNLWHPVSIGQTFNLSETMSSCALIHEATTCGATHVHVMEANHEMVRYQIYHDLVKEHQPWLDHEQVFTF